MLGCSSQSVNGITPNQVTIPNVFLSGLIDYFTIWYMATCHPCVISVFSNELIPNAITINSQSRPGGKMDQQHVVPNLIFLETFPPLL